ncbi:MAG: substrate-binding domain-containing protein [Chloroflexota bacterium]
MGSQAASKELVQYLINMGHRDIGFITSYYSKGLAIRRWLGFQEAMLENQVPIRPELIIEAEYTPQASLTAMEKLMTLEQPPTAVFAMTDIYMRGIIDYIAKYNVNVPKDLSVVSFDYQALAQRTTPAVTSIVISTYELGWKTAEMFIDIMKNPIVKARHESLPYKLEVRDTTGPPRG